MPFEEDFIETAYDAGGNENALVDAWEGNHLDFYSSLGAVDRTKDIRNRSYPATGYLKPNLGRPNLRVLTEAHATKTIMHGNEAAGVEFIHDGKLHKVTAFKEVIFSSGVI